MSILQVKNYFAEYGLQDKIIEFDSSSATVQLAAQVLNTQPGRIAKTLSCDLDGKTILVVMAGDVKVNNALYKAVFGKKAKMLSATEVEKRVGHAVGGVCPFAVNSGVEVYLDVSLKKYSTVFPACGSANSAIELIAAELEKYACSKGWIDIGKPMVGE